MATGFREISDLDSDPTKITGSEALSLCHNFFVIRLLFRLQPVERTDGVQLGPALPPRHHAQPQGGAYQTGLCKYNL